MIDLQKIKADTDANIIIVAGYNGIIIDSTKTEYAKNFALMAESAFSMCSDLLKDMTNSDLDQLIARSADHYFIANRVDSETIVLIASDNLSKFGLHLKYMNSIENK